MLVFIRVWLMKLKAVVTLDSPVTFGLSATSQVYVVFTGTIPFVPFAGITVNVWPLQITTGVVVIFGLGLTLTVNW